MLARDVVTKRYAEALYSLARENNQVDVIQMELEQFAAIFQQSEELKDLFFNPQIPAKLKKELLARTISGEFPNIINFLYLLLDKNRSSYVLGIKDAFIELADEYRNVVHAEVRVAMPLSEQQELTLQAKLENQTGKKVKLRVFVDESLLGGVSLRMGDRIIDGSVRGRLQALKEKLMEAQVGKIGVSNG
jgi:F-type H+-transporting ATPase subunit delta